jgi:hypothetical protein
MADHNARLPQGNGVIAAGIVIAALILAWGSPSKEPRFQIAGSGNGVVRLDTDSGEMLACDMQGCRRIELPMRARTWGPVTLQVGDDRKPAVQPQLDQKQLPPPKQP